MKIYFATDHAGFELKNILKDFVVTELGLVAEDCGAHSFNAVDDYPDFVSIAATKVAANPEEDRALVLGGSGQGEAMVANRVPGVRATVYYGGQPEIITLSREHNNANVLSLGARFVTPEEAKEVVRAWLTIQFPGDERHVRRINKF